MRKQLLIGLASAVLVWLGQLVAVAQSAYFQALTNLNPIVYFPLQETAQPPTADVETNYGSLGRVADAIYSGHNMAKGSGGATADGDTAASDSDAWGGFCAVPTTDPRTGLTSATAFTVEAWVNPAENTRNFQGIVAKSGANNGGIKGANNQAGFCLSENYIAYLDSGNLTGFDFHVYNGAGHGGAEVIVPYTVQNGVWYHVVGVFDGTNCWLYINGTNMTSIGAGYQIPMTGSYVPDTWNPIQIGSSRGLNSNNTFHGSIDEVAIYTNALTQAQVQSHFVAASGAGYASTVSADHPYMYWRMDSPGYTAPDPGTYPIATNYGVYASSFGAMYGTASQPGVAGPSFSGMLDPNNGNSSYAVAINGIGGNNGNSLNVPIGYTNGGTAQFAADAAPVIITNLSYTDPAAPLLNPTNGAGNHIPFSVTTWFKANPHDWNRFQTLFGHSDSGWRMSMNTSGVIQWNPGPGGEVATPYIYDDGNWHQFIGTYDGSNVLTYVDGVLVQSGTTTNNYSGSALYPIIGGDPFYLDSGNAYPNGNGGTGNTSYRNRDFSGRLAHFAFFTNVLSAAQIQNLYTTANPNQPAYILGQPVTGRVNPATNFLFFGVVAGGSAPLTYQWYYNTVSNYAGATNLVDDGVKYTNTMTANMTVSNLANADSGYYFVIVNNSFGSVTSRLASLSVNYAPTITAQNPPTDFTLYPNQTTTLSVTANGANGTSTLSYYWYTNSVLDPSVTGSTYNLGPVTAGNNGETFQCVVSNFAGTANSTLVTLTVAPFPAALTGSPFSSNVLALVPTSYWPMHETGETPVAAYTETNYGTLGQIGDGYYDDWRQNVSGSAGNLLGGGVTNNLSTLHGFPSAIAGDPNPSVQFSGNNRSSIVIPRVSPTVPGTSPANTTLTPPFTLEGWVKPYDNLHVGIMVGQDSGTFNSTGVRGGFDWVYSTNNAPNTFAITIYNGTNGSATQPMTTASYPPGFWYHVVTTFDGTNVAYYINGVQDSLQNSSAATMNPNTWDPITFACGRGLAANVFKGGMDEVAIYTNILPVSEIQKHYNDGTNAAYANYEADVLADNPWIYYRMDSPSYFAPPISTWPVLTNYGAVGVNGVYTPGSIPGGTTGPSAAGGVPNTALAANGVSMFADAGFIAQDNPAKTHFTVSAWMKGNPADSSRGWQGVVSHSDFGWRMGIDGAGGNPTQGNGYANFNIGAGNPGGSDIGNNGGTFIINDGQWHFVVGTFDGSNQTVYVDGLKAASTFNVNYNPTNILHEEVFLGAYPANGAFGNSATSIANEIGRVLAGSVCEAAFWSGTALTAAQVSALYNSAQVGPVIEKQPNSFSANQNSAFTNSFVGNGTSPLFYQWYENGAPRSGQTNASLVLPSVQISDGSTNWYVVVTNNYGSVTSAVWTLTVNSVPSITQDLPNTNLTLYVGGHATFAIAASGAIPLHYQWYSNNVAIGGATSPSYTLVNAQPVFSTNNYYCIVTNSAGTVTSLTATVAVVPVPSVIPYSQVILADNPFGFWALNEAEVGGGDNGVIANDYWGGNDGIYTNVTLGQPGFNPTVDPAGTSAEFGINSLANGDVYGIATNVDFSSTNNSEFSIEAWIEGNYAQTTDAGIISKGSGGGGEQFDLDTGSHVVNNGQTDHDFRFLVRDASGTVYRIASTVNPANLWHHVVGVCDESNSVLTLYVDGLPVGSNSIPSGSGLLASTRSMLIGARPSSATSSNDWQFVGWIQDVAVYNYALSAQQVQNHFNAGDIPASIVTSPTNFTTGEFGTATFSALVIGTPPISYQWFKNSSPLSGQTNVTLVLTNVPVSDNGSTYYLEVGNAFNSAAVDSDTATLTVVSGPPQIFSDVPLQVFVQSGANTTIPVTAYGTMPLVYQWQGSDTNAVTWTNVLDSARVTGSKSNILAITSAKKTDGGSYQVIITNTFGSVTSSIAELIVGSLPIGFNGSGLGWTAQQNSGAFSVGAFANNVLTLTDNSGSEARSSFYNYPQYIGGFKATFTYQAGGNRAADGIAFVLQNDPRGPAALGGSGGALGVSGITPSWELELNIYAGNGDGIGAGIFTNGANGINPFGLNVNIGSGDPIDFSLSYAQGKLALTMVDEVNTALSFSTNLNVGDLSKAVGGNSTAYVGFTGATGGSLATQTITNFSFISIPTQAIQVTATNTSSVTWPGAVPGYVLQQSFTLGQTANWINVTNPDNVVNGQHEVLVPTVSSNAFFRLNLQP